MAGRYKFTKKKRGKKKKILTFLVLLLLGAITLTSCVNARVQPLIFDIASAEANRMSLAIINESIARQLEEDGVSYGTLYSISYDESGRVSSIQSNISAINNERASIALFILEGYSGKTLQTRIPLGTISGIDLFSGLGPKITITLSPAPSIQTTVYNEFLEAGINQTVHRIMLDVSVDTCVIVPSNSFTVTTKTTVCIAETIIVGEVPEAYTDINRTGGDVSESDIDDIYDFGATVS